LITRKIRLALYFVLLPLFAVIFALPGSTNAQTDSATPTSTVGTVAMESILTLPLNGLGQDSFKATITLIDMSSRAKRQIAIPAALHIRGAVLSPDGKWIAFTGFAKKDFSLINPGYLYIIGTDGSHFQQLTTPSTQAEVRNSVSLPAWSSDNQQLLFVIFSRKLVNNKQVSAGGALMLLKWDGSKAPPQTTIMPDMPVSNDSAFVAWSPDNKTILFSAIPKANPGDNDYPVVLSTGIDGKNTQPFKQNGTNAAWSPDGKKIAFTSGDSLVITNADGSNPTTVFKSASMNTGLLFQVAWSPDGSQLLYSSIDGTKNATSLYVANADGANPVLLLQDNDTAHFGSFSWTAMSTDAWNAIPVGTPTPTVPPTRTPKPSATPKVTSTPQS